jgi:hypothetical protein
MDRLVAFVSALSLLLGTLHGTVMRGPITPVCMVGKPCDAPAAHVTLYFAHADRVWLVRTDASGRYRLRLPAGVYAVTVHHTGPGRGLEPRTARAYAGRDRRANFHLDTGIR